jgi:hypothetical protein
VFGVALVGFAPAARAAAPDDDPFIVGIKIRVGGRFDNVRRCVATKAGTPGGPAADVSVFAEFPVAKGTALHVDLPMMRPILFATAFGMLQFEPSATLKFRDTSPGSVGWVAGPTLGLALHYGPDYHSELRTREFFALGPIIGGYVGIDFRRPGKAFSYEVGVTPYVIPLFGVGDPRDHRGVVIGGLLDGALRFPM